MQDASALSSNTWHADRATALACIQEKMIKARYKQVENIIEAKLVLVKIRMHTDIYNT